MLMQVFSFALRRLSGLLLLRSNLRCRALRAVPLAKPLTRLGEWDASLVQMATGEPA